ncbi:MAG: glutamyl-tRNA reductase [Chlamydiae bacterium]|nr:glutamyl-tRNA reductase [Chlamydiota bacterium]MBI3266352.1 glutamyl-tRNA reductase [Chlamydiota bacterium]
MGKVETNIQVIGLNHRTAQVQTRERLAFTKAQATACLARVREMGLADEAVILSTCNRVELYHVWDRSDSYESLSQFLSQFHQVSLPDFEKSLYFYRDDEAVRHLFRVASGLDSMVVGEKEVLGQVKKAYFLASSTGATGPLLNVLFQRSFYVAKRLQNETTLHSGSISVSSVAVQLAQMIFGELNTKTILLVGAGKMSEQTVQRLVERGVKGMIASNRSYEKAQALAQKFEGQAVRLDEIHQVARDVDIVISSTAAPHFILHQNEVSGWMKERRQRPLLMIDIAVPRDIDPEVNRLDNVYLYNIDDLKAVADQNFKERLKEQEKADSLVESEVKRFMDRMIKYKSVH